ncbi:MAG TPA: hypothetical protein VG733_10930 [Chthoniobacteraceae bacterium]|nr:hypothetical protein [Chthoniobacteraceae bacterium]
MKTFEEKFTAWVDGELKGKELAEFEAQLPDALEARLEKQTAGQIGEILREHGRAPELANPDFFNHQLMQRIEAEAAPKADPIQWPPRRRTFFFTLPRLALAGAFSLVVAFGLYHTLIPQNATAPAEPTGKFEVINLKSGEPGTRSSIYYSSKNDVQVVDINIPSLPGDNKHASPSPKKDKDK